MKPMDTNEETPEERRARRATWPVVVRRLHDPEEYPVLSAKEALEMMWPLACDAWAMMGEPVDESRLRRDVVRVIRRGR